MSHTSWSKTTTRITIATTIATGILAAVALVGTAPASAARAPITTQMASACAGVPETTTVYDGVPGPVFYKRLQCLASMPSARPYTGPIDGAMGPNSWMGAQARLAVGHYYGAELDPYENMTTVIALRLWANDHGYALPLDGYWSGAAYAAVADCLNQEF